jgi:hypothetical protein
MGQTREEITQNLAERLCWTSSSRRTKMSGEDHAGNRFPRKLVGFLA